MEVWDWGKRFWSLERFFIGICEYKCCTFHSQASEFVFTQYFFSIIKHAGLRKLQVLGDWECGLRSLQGHFHRSILQRTLATAFSCRVCMHTRSKNITAEKTCPKIHRTGLLFWMEADWSMTKQRPNAGSLLAGYIWVWRPYYRVYTRLNFASFSKLICLYILYVKANTHFFRVSFAVCWEKRESSSLKKMSQEFI